MYVIKIGEKKITAKFEIYLEQYTILQFRIDEF